MAPFVGDKDPSKPRPLHHHHSRPRPIELDTTELRAYGAGEWYVQKHRSGRRWTWRKLHLGVDEHTKEIVAVEITASPVHDSQVFPRVLTQISGKVYEVSGDGAYDTKACYKSMGQRGAKPRFPLGETRRRGGVLTPLRSLPSGMPIFVRFRRMAGMPGG